MSTLAVVQVCAVLSVAVWIAFIATMIQRRVQSERAGRDVEASHEVDVLAENVAALLQGAKFSEDQKDAPHQLIGQIIHTRKAAAYSVALLDHDDMRRFLNEATSYRLLQKKLPSSFEFENLKIGEIASATARFVKTEKRQSEYANNGTKH